MTEHEQELRARRLKGIPKPREVSVSTTQDLSVLLMAQDGLDDGLPDEPDDAEDAEVAAQAEEAYERARQRLEHAPGYDQGQTRSWDDLAAWEQRVWIDAVKPCEE